VLFTHPFHSVGVASFHKTYPKVPLYGSPRHLRRFPDLPWAGDLSDPKVRDTWLPEVAMWIPAGCEFADPKPEDKNHLSACLVLHRQSRTVHVDDFFCYFEDIWQMGTVAWLTFGPAGIRDGDLKFHVFLEHGIKQHPDGPGQLLRSVEEMLREWDFENLCVAHAGVLLGGARARVQQLVDLERPRFEEYASKLKQGMCYRGYPLLPDADYECG